MIGKAGRRARLSGDRACTREVLLAVRFGTKPYVVRAVRACLDAMAVSVSVSRSLEEYPTTATLVVLVDGWGTLTIQQALERCRSLFSGHPAIAVVARERGAVAAALDAGATDCVQWPIDCDELSARVRTRLAAAQRIGGALIALDATRQTIDCNGVRATLTRGQFKILRELMREPARWIPSRELMNVALGSTRADTTQVRVHVHAIRRKLLHEAWRLRGDRALGYFFEASQVNSGARSPSWGSDSSESKN